MHKLILGLVFISSYAMAADMTCVETAKSKKENANDTTITINVNKDKKSLWIMVKPNGKGKSVSGMANRDDHNSLKDKEAKDGTYNLDEEYDRTKEARFVASNSEIATSDSDSIIFVEKAILAGKPGKLSLSGGQANDGESGDAWIWGRSGEWACK